MGEIRVWGLFAFCGCVAKIVLRELNSFSILSKDVRSVVERARVFSLNGILFPRCEILTCLPINKNVQK